MDQEDGPRPARRLSPRRSAKRSERTRREIHASPWSPLPSASRLKQQWPCPRPSSCCKYSGSGQNRKSSFRGESTAAVQNESSERLHSFPVATAAWAGFAHRTNAPERLTDGNYEGCLGLGVATCKYGKSELLYL